MNLVVSLTLLFSVAPLIAMTAENLSIIVTLHGNDPGEHYGRSMAGVGDVNGDGLADLLVGDARDGYHAGERRCHLYLGKPYLECMPDLVITQPEVYSYEGTIYDDKFGVIVDGGEDIDGDGIDDFVITSPEWYWLTGKIYFYRGCETPNTDPTVAIASHGSSWITLFWATDLRGRLVQDVNGDGFGELACLVGPCTRDVGAYVYFGGAPMDSVHDLELRGPGYADPGYDDLMLGSDIAGGDFNGDGYSDLAIGAYASEENLDVQDAAWIYAGGYNMDGTVDLQISPHRVPAEYRVIAPGDLNGDGYDDIVTAQAVLLSDSLEPSSGYICFGGAPWDSVVDLSFTGTLSPGTLALTGGHINDDPFSDIVVSDMSWDPDVTDWGLMTFLGGFSMDSIPDFTESGPQGFGETVTWIGDMTGDGWPEFAVSNPSGAGEIYIYTMGEVHAGELPVHPAGSIIHITPNPSHGSTRFEFQGNSMSGATIGVYDLAGHLVTLLQSGVQLGDQNRLFWNGTDGYGQPVPEGTYIFRLQEHDRTMSGKLVIIR